LLLKAIIVSSLLYQYFSRKDSFFFSMGILSSLSALANNFNSESNTIESFSFINTESNFQRSSLITNSHPNEVNKGFDQELVESDKFKSAVFQIIVFDSDFTTKTSVFTANNHSFDFFSI
jgi:hypothetical protein